MLLSPIDDPLPKQSAASSVTFSRFRAVLFNDLLDDNPTNRSRALENIVQIVTEWARVVTDNNALSDLSRQGSFSTNTNTNTNPTPPFSPAVGITNALGSIEGALLAATTTTATATQTRIRQQHASQINAPTNLKTLINPTTSTTRSSPWKS
ncbi:hypothetical protein BGZ94_005788 [Podila epigama]|nr:hypothetical protein BGZ94_005788 [Podila epigama]